MAGRELAALFATPVAWVFLVVFLAAAGAATFFAGGFFARGQADLRVFFGYHPWLYLVFVPAVAMRLWAEERRSGTIELLLTLPVTPAEAVLAKLLAGWAFLAVALAGTLPLWATVAWLGDPDHGAILAGYLGSLLLAGLYLSVGALFSALTSSQVTAFVLAVAASFGLTVAGSPIALALAGEAAPPALLEALAGFSPLARFDRIARGVLDLRDLLYFAGAIALFVYLTVLAVARPAGAARTALAGGLAAVLFAAGTLAAHRGLEGWRLDLTADRLFTLTDTTRSVLAAIEEPIALDLYASPDLAEAAPALAAHAGRVRELLDEYVAAADGALVLATHDPAPFSAAEDRAVAAGLIGLPAGPGGQVLWLGLAARNAVDGREAIPLFRPERAADLEAELTGVIARLAEPEPPRIGVLSTLPMAGGAAPDVPQAALRPFALWQELTQAFSVQRLALDADRIDPALAVLMLVHPKDLPPATLYAIDQYVLSGGAVLAFADPFSEAEARRAPPAEAFRPRSSGLGPLGAAWGLALAPGVAAADPRAAVPVNVGTAARPQPVSYLAWLSLARPNLDRDDPVTARLDRLTLASAGVLQGVPGTGTTVAPLVVTSPDAAAVDAGRVGDGADPQALLAEFRPGDGPLLLAARVAGPVASAFPDGPPEGVASPPGGHRARSEAPARIIVVADTDLLDDRFWLEPASTAAPGAARTAFADNGAFVLNALEDLAGGRDLSALRGGAVADRPLDRIEGLRQTAETRLRATEQQLVARLTETRTELARLEDEGAGRGTAARAAVADLQTEVLSLRAELRAVRGALREDVARLEARVAWFHTAGVPGLVAVIGLGWGAARDWHRRRRRRRAGGREATSP